MSLSESDIKILMAGLIAAREHYCRDLCEYGGDGMETPQPDIKAAMELMGMNWSGNLNEIYHGDVWTGNEQFKP